MAVKDDQVWHRSEEPGGHEATVRLTGHHFDVIKAWAEQHQVSGIFGATAVTFGFTENFTIIGNLCRELSNPESKAILNQWSDNPYITQLTKLFYSYIQSTDLATTYAGIPQSGSRSQTKTILRDAGAHIDKEHFLLEMIVNPLPQAANHRAYYLRRVLRLWLIVQALQRSVEDSCYHDRQIQIVASSLSLTSYDSKWALIDKLLHRAAQTCPTDAYSFEQFTLAIQYAATQLKPSYPDKANRKERRVLNALQTLAEGHCNPIRDQTGSDLFELSFKGILSDRGSSLFSGKHQGTAQVFAYSDLDDPQADEEDLEQSIWLEVDSEETPERQRLSGRSVLLQTAELSHYLPWSWEKALPPEIIALERWLNDTLVSDHPRDQLGAAITWISVQFARSLDFILEFEITENAQPEWSLTKDFSRAHRDPPRRHHSWSPSETEVSAVEAFETSYSISLPKQIRDILRSHGADYNPPATSLHDLWVRAYRGDPKPWFDAHAKVHFPRLTSAKLANIQPQRVFSQTADHSLARLISAHPSAALPAACGYANWDIQQVQSGFALKVQHATETSDRVNLLGSLLAPLESLLVNGVRRATDNLYSSVNDDPIAFHNNLAQYTVMALYAATGCRYLSEPFESIGHFCDEPPAVFINDKSDDGLHNGRLVPLADEALAILNVYRTHLLQLSEPLKSQRPALARRIEALLNGQPSSLPLFFLLDSYGHWHSLSDEILPGDNLFEWPLPRNLFRHRFAQQLLRSHVNPEVIDGWMGHGERGVATYGNHSSRCWREDATQYRQAVNACFDRLNFVRPPTHPALHSLTLSAKPPADGCTEPSSFGQAKRAEKRRQARDEARSLARKDLEFYLEAKPVDELTQGYVDDLVRRMLMRENGLPHPQAGVRMEVLIQWLEDSGSGYRQFIRHRLTRLDTERSLLRSSCPNALRLMPALKRWVQETKRSIRQARFSKSNALALTVAFLAIEKRISYPRLLEDLIQGKNYRVIQHDRRVFLEYSERLDPDDFDQPIQRHQIDHTTGRLLARGLGIKATIILDEMPCPKPLLSLVQILEGAELNHQPKRQAPTMSWLLRSLHRTVEQANLIDLPGVVAAALSERNPPTSICLYDYFRLTEGKRYRVPNSTNGQLPPEQHSLPNIPAMTASPYPKAFYDSAKSYFRGLHDILNQYTKSGALRVARMIEQHCKAQSHSVSSAIVLVGYWIAFRIREGKGRQNQKHNPYAANSIKRYLSTLTQAFQGLANDADLMIMSEEEVTELCAQMLALRAGKQQDFSYFSARLIEFFNWASERGVSAPDWDELDLGNARRSVRPRLFSEQEYLQALTELLRLDSENNDRGMQGAFVLLLAYRFGLRAWEAIGLSRGDWCQAGELTWVLVQNNAVRSLKHAKSSRRAVPLMFPLTDVEQTLVETILARYETRNIGNATNKPILCDVADNRVSLTMFARCIPADIACVLKQVTGNQRMSLHQARHAFCNVLTTALFEIPTPLSTSLFPSLDAKTVRQIILGKHELPSRRCAMAIARALGHQTPSTHFRSYNHLLTEWADHLTPVNSHYVSRIPNAVCVDAWEVDTPAIKDVPTTIFSQHAVLTPAVVIEAMRLMSLGYATDRTESMLRLPPGDLSDLETLVDRINAGMRFKVYDPEKAKKTYVYGKTLPKYLLKSRPDGVWPRLLECAGGLPSRGGLDFGPTLPSLDTASNLIGRNGHLLMNTPEEAHLLRLVVESFELPPTAYSAVLKSRPDDIERASGMLAAGQFQPTTQSSIQLDTFNEDYDKRFGRGRSYAGLAHTKPAIGPLHDGVELVLAFIAIAAAYCPQDSPLSPYTGVYAGHSSVKSSGSFAAISES
jgi:integrase